MTKLDALAAINDFVAEETEQRRPKYHAVNSQWPADTNEGRDLKPTPEEAISAARRLYRFAMKKPFRGKIKLTSGNRYSYIRNGTMYVNPDWKNDWHKGGGGWHELIHLLSHSFAQQLFPRAKGHGPQHAFLEKEMIAYAINSGWLDGRLRKPEKPKPDAKAIRYQRIVANIERWDAKLRRAENALRKLKRQKARYDRAA